MKVLHRHQHRRALCGASLELLKKHENDTFLAAANKLKEDQLLIELIVELQSQFKLHKTNQKQEHSSNEVFSSNAHFDDFNSSQSASSASN
jgi:hypothetical protein